MKIKLFLFLAIAIALTGRHSSPSAVEFTGNTSQ